jgi:hypothetical protein
MDRVSCTIILYEGQWRKKPSEHALRTALKRAVAGDCSLVELEFVPPSEDIAFETEVVVATEWSDEEHVRDRIIEGLLRRFEPEYESMIEVEVCDAC